jgi:hypothetical protein
MRSAQHLGSRSSTPYSVHRVVVLVVLDGNATVLLASVHHPQLVLRVLQHVVTCVVPSYSWLSLPPGDGHTLEAYSTVGYVSTLELPSPVRLSDLQSW